MRTMERQELLEKATALLGYRPALPSDENPAGEEEFGDGGEAPYC